MAVFISRRDFIGAMALTPILVHAPRQSSRAFSWVNRAPEGKYPDGVRHATFFSPSNKADVGYCIYLPPEYDTTTAAKQRYPVVYELHGGLVGSELGATMAGEHLDSAIRRQVIPPVIYVFPNGGRVSHYDYPPLQSYGETALVRELVPHIDRTYRTIARREARGIGGFSAGARGTARIIFKYPDVFSSAVPISGGYQHEKYIQEHDGRSQMPPDRVFEPGNNAYDLARRYAQQRRHVVRILIIVGTEDANYEGTLDWMKHLDALGIGHKRIIVDGVGHNARRLLEQVGDQVRQFHAENFKQSRA